MLIMTNNAFIQPHKWSEISARFTVNRNNSTEII